MYSIKIIHTKNINIAEIVSNEIAINSYQDALDVMADARYVDADSIISYEKNLPPEFFDLSTRFAGEILQKFSTYPMKIAIVGDFEKHTSYNLKASSGRASAGTWFSL
jgi:hypothetical protein